MKPALFLLLMSISLYAADTPAPAPAPVMKGTSKAYYSIDPKNRAADWAQAYDLLKREKPTLKISLRSSNAPVITNVIDMEASSKGTLLFVKVQSNLGPKIVLIPVEEIEELYYSP